MDPDTPKQFLLLAGKPVLMHSLIAFHSAVPEALMVVALAAKEFIRWEVLQKEYGFNIPHQVVAGGETRFHSVKNALQTLPGEGIAAIHDAARPLLSVELIKRCFLQAESDGNAVSAIPVNESMRQTVPGGNRRVERKEFFLIQTPQVFPLADLHATFGQEYRQEFTDEATVVESAGIKIHLVEGETRNIKITGPDDLVVAQALMSRPFQR